MEFFAGFVIGLLVAMLIFINTRAGMKLSIVWLRTLDTAIGDALSSFGKLLNDAKEYYGARKALLTQRRKHSKIWRSLHQADKKQINRCFQRIRDSINNAEAIFEAQEKARRAYDRTARRMEDVNARLGFAEYWHAETRRRLLYHVLPTRLVNLIS